MKKQIFLLLVTIALIFSQNANAEHLEIDFYGISYHLVGYGYRYAPMKIDNDAAWVFNPGIGFTYDFREKVDEQGLSPLIMLGYFKDCDDRPFFFGGAGGRYRHKLTKELLFDVNFGLILSYAQDWSTNEYNSVIMPIVNIGFSKLLLGRWWGYRLTYTPENVGISATTGGDLLFMNLSVQI